MIKVFVLFLFAVVAGFAQQPQPGGGSATGGPCANVSGSATLGYVLTATSGGALPNCNWQGGAGSSGLANCSAVTFAAGVATYPSLANCNVIAIAPSANVSSVATTNGWTTSPTGVQAGVPYFFVFAEPASGGVTNVLPSILPTFPTPVDPSGSGITVLAVTRWNGTSFDSPVLATNSGFTLWPTGTQPAQCPDGSGGRNFVIWASAANQNINMEVAGVCTAVNNLGTTFVWGVQTLANNPPNFVDGISKTGIPHTSIPQCGGDVTGNINNCTVAKIQNQTVSSSTPSAGQVFQFVGGSWVPTILTKPIAWGVPNLGSPLSSQTFYYVFPYQYACTVHSWTAGVDTGTVTIDIWKVASGSALPTSSNPMVGTGTKPGVASGQVATGTPTGWTTTSVSPGDIFGFSLTFSGGAQTALLSMQCY